MEKDKKEYLSDEVRLKVATYIAETTDDKMLELTAINQNDSMSIACMIASNELRDRLVAVTDLEILEHQIEKWKEANKKIPESVEEKLEELREKAKPFFLNRRILQIYFRLQRSVGGHSLQEWFKIMQTQEEGATEPDIMDDVDNKLFGNM